MNNNVEHAHGPAFRRRQQRLRRINPDTTTALYKLVLLRVEPGTLTSVRPLYRDTILFLFMVLCVLFCFVFRCLLILRECLLLCHAGEAVTGGNAVFLCAISNGLFDLHVTEVVTSSHSVPGVPDDVVDASVVVVENVQQAPPFVVPFLLVLMENVAGLDASSIRQMKFFEVSLSQSVVEPFSFENQNLQLG